MQTNKFKNKVALITGSSQGIGKATAKALLQQGAKVIINGRNSEKLAKAKKGLLKYGNDILAIYGDISKQEHCEELIAKTVAHYGTLDILINNAGMSMEGNMIDLSPSVFKTVFDINVLGSVNLTIESLPHLRKSGGSIIYISSLAAIHGLPKFSAYSSSKMALRAIAESLKIEEPKIHVGLMYVGFTQNDDTKRTINSDGSLVALGDRSNIKTQTQESVAHAILGTLKKRKFITTLSSLGRVHQIANRISPWLVEKIIQRSFQKLNKKSNVLVLHT